MKYSPRVLRLALLGVSVLSFACSSDKATAPAAAPDNAALIRPAKKMDGITLPASGPLSDGGSFTGTLVVKRFDVNENRELVVTGTLSGIATLADGSTQFVTQSFSTVGTLTRSTHSTSTSVSTTVARTDALAAVDPSSGLPGNCDVLFLDLGPLHLNLLGLEVNLAEVILDVNALAGGGNLLGNLLCAVVGLFDGFAVLAAIQNILDLINGIIGGLGAI